MLKTRFVVVSLILSLVFIGLFSVIPSAFASYHQVQALFEKGFEASQNGEFAKAISFFDQVLEIDPNYVPALNNKGSALRILGMYEEAIVYFDKALEIDPNDVKALYNKGNALSDLEKYEEAIVSYDKALEIEPNHVKALYNKGNALYDLEKYEEAIVSYDKALEIDPNDVKALYNKGLALYYLQKYEEAIVSYDKVLEIEPNHVKALNNKNKLLEIMGKPIEIMEKLQIPDWIRNNAKWWSEGQIGDSDFTSGIQFMIKENIMVIPDLPEEVTQMELKDEKRAMGMEREQNVPDWVRNNAGWWADGLISDDDFVSGIKYLVEQGIIRV